MVSCLILIPLIAVSGTSLPDLAKGLLDWNSTATASTGNQLSEAPSFAPSQATAYPGSQHEAVSQGVPLGGYQAASAWPGSFEVPGPGGGSEYPSLADHRNQMGGAGQLSGVGQSVSPSTNYTDPNHAEQVIRASYDVQVDTPSYYLEQTGLTAGQTADWDRSRELSRLPAPVDLMPPGAPLPRPEAGYPVSSPPVTTDRFTHIQKRLSDLGATYYLLEAWGKDAQFFRFHARMAMGGANYSRHFEATDANALQAMSKVLQQVEAWRAGP